MITFGSTENPMLASFQSGRLQFRPGAVVIAAVAVLVAIFGFVWPRMIRGLNAQLENLHDHGDGGPQPTSKERT